MVSFFASSKLAGGDDDDDEKKAPQIRTRRRNETNETRMNIVQTKWPNQQHKDAAD